MCSKSSRENDGVFDSYQFSTSTIFYLTDLKLSIFNKKHSYNVGVLDIGHFSDMDIDNEDIREIFS